MRRGKENKSKIESENASKVAFEDVSAVKLLESVNLMMGLLDKLNKSIQQDIAKSIDELRNIIINEIEKNSEDILINEKSISTLRSRVDLLEAQYHDLYARIMND